METTKSGFVTLVGRPNVGKSTLMNHLIGQKIAITSNKPQTTRNRIHTVYTDKRGQIVFVDTPGIHQAKNKLGEYMVNAAVKTCAEADVILWLVEPCSYIGAGDRKIAGQLKRSKCPVILIVNKIDTIPKEKLGAVIGMYRELMEFDDVIAVSALRNVNTGQVIDAIMRCLPYGPLFYDEDTVTDQPMRQICAEMVREKALRLLADEIPHGIAVTIERMEERNDGLFDIEATIICERENHKQIIIGKGGSMIKKIGSSARFDMEKMLEARVNLKLWVKVRKEWRDNELYLKNYGYTRDM